jgi:hypothetical protein
MTTTVTTKPRMLRIVVSFVRDDAADNELWTPRLRYLGRYVLFGVESGHSYVHRRPNASNVPMSAWVKQTFGFN